MEFWNYNSILENYTENTPPGIIFQEICDLIGNYYVEKGWKYSSSSRKLSYQKNDLTAEIKLYSSHHNMAGSFVNLETLPYVKSKELKKWIKENSIGRNEYIYAPKKYSFRNLNVYGITKDEFSKLLQNIDDFIQLKFNIENNVSFIEFMFLDIEEVILDNFACYLTMKNDSRLLNILDNAQEYDISNETKQSLSKMYYR